MNFWKKQRLEMIADELKYKVSCFVSDRLRDEHIKERIEVEVIVRIIDSEIAEVSINADL